MSHLEPEDKYTSIPNDILEVIYKLKLNGCQSALVMAIWRFTFGFHRCQYEISAGFLANATGYTLRAVKKELDALTKKQIVIIIPNGDRRTHTIKINKQLANLVNSNSLVNNQTLVNNRSKTSEQMDTSLVNNRSPKKENLNKRRNKGTTTTEPTDSTPYKKIVDLYHENCPTLSKVKVISETRQKHIKARYKQYENSLDVFIELFTKAGKSDFLRGANDRNWVADFDWLMNEANMTKVLEDKFINRQKWGGNFDDKYDKYTEDVYDGGWHGDNV